MRIFTPGWTHVALTAMLVLLTGCSRETPVVPPAPIAPKVPLQAQAPPKAPPKTPPKQAPESIEPESPPSEPVRVRPRKPSTVVRKDLSPLKSHTMRIYSVAFSGDGKLACSASADHTVRVWNVATGEELWPFRHEDRVFAAALSPDGRHLLSSDLENDVRLWDVETGALVHHLEGHKSPAIVVAFSADGKTALSADGRTIRSWDVATGKQRHMIERFPAPAGEGKSQPRIETLGARYLAFRPGNSEVLFGHGRGAEVWDLASKKTLRKAGYPAAMSAAGSADGQFAIFSGDESYRSHQDRTLWLMDMKTGQLRHKLPGHLVDFKYGGTAPKHSPSAVMSLALSRDGSRALSGGHDHTIRLWDAGASTQLARLEGHLAAVTCLTFSPDERLALSAGDDMTVRLWDLEAKKELRQFHATSWYARNQGEPERPRNEWLGKVLFVTKYRRILVTGARDHIVRVWDEASKKELHRLPAHDDRILSLDIADDGRLGLSLSKDGVICVWNLENGAKLKVIKADEAQLAAFDPNGKRIVSAGPNGAIRVWEIESGKTVLRMEDQATRFTAMAVSPDGKKIITAGDVCLLWDFENQKAQFLGKGMAISALAYSPDGNFILETIAQDRIAVRHHNGQTATTGEMEQLLKQQWFKNHAETALSHSSGDTSSFGSSRSTYTITRTVTRTTVSRSRR